MPRLILLADDHSAFRQNARILLERKGFVVIVEAADGLEAVRLAQQTQPEVALVDLNMPVLSGLEATRQIVESCRATKVITLTVHSDEPYVVSALRAGAHGYIVKSRLADDLDCAFDAVLRGKLWLSPPIRYPAAEALVVAANRGV